MSTNYVLIDFENVQRFNMGLLYNYSCKVFLFVGANQSKMPFDLVSAVQKLGEHAKYVKIEGSGRNALDFHIAFYLGRLAESDPEGNFYVVSKDTGFDPLMQYLKSSHISAQRITDLNAVVKKSIPEITAMDERMQTIIKSLRAQPKPRNAKTLHNVINTLFMKQLDEKKLAELIEQLKKLGVISVNPQGRVSYKLPEEKQ